MVLVDGRDFGEIWMLTLRANAPFEWIRVPVAGPGYPANRTGFSAVYDSLRDRVVVYGGAPSFDPVGDVWTLSLGDPPRWAPLSVVGEAPVPRSAHAAIFDPVRDRMVIFGGSAHSGYEGEQYFSDTWAIEFAAGPRWQRVAAGGPAPGVRQGASAVYDPWSRRMVLFGGWARVIDPEFGWLTQRYSNETWTLPLDADSAWRPVPATGNLRPRQAHIAVVDPVERRMIVSGGEVGDLDHWVGDTWALPLREARPGESLAWEHIETTGEIPAVSSHAAIHSPEHSSMIQFGGERAGNGCFELSLATRVWSVVNVAVSGPFPTRRTAPVLVPDAATNALMLFGGAAWGCQHDLWTFPFAGAAGWSVLPTSGIAPTCGAPNFVLDPVRRRLLAFTAVSTPRSRGVMDQVWSMALDEPRAWTRLAPAGTVPLGRIDFSLTYDPVRDRVLLFGGAFYHNPGDNYGETLDDLWQLSLGDLRWTRLQPVNSPGTRRLHGMLYDRTRDRLIVLAGARSGFLQPYPIYDDWELPLGRDTLRWAPFGPDAPTSSAAVIDPMRDRVVLWDGARGAWTLPLASPTAWAPLVIAGGPPTPRILPGLAFDPIGDQMLAFGGYDGSMKGDLLAMRFSRSVNVVFLPRDRDTRHAGGPDVIEAAVLADRGFSPDSVRSETVTLAGAPALGRGHDDERDRRGGRRPHRDGDGPQWRDVNADGRNDLVLRFAASALELAPTDPVVLLRGRTTHFEILGRAILGSGHPRERERPLEPVAAQSELQLAPRNPARSTVTLAYSLATDGLARLQMFDLAGRRLFDRALEREAAGPHEITLTDRTLPAGVYLVRLDQGGRSVVARAVVLR